MVSASLWTSKHDWAFMWFDVHLGESTCVSLPQILIDEADVH